VESITQWATAQSPSHHRSLWNRNGACGSAHSSSSVSCEVFAQDTAFKIERDPDTVRAPDWVAEIFLPSDWPGEVLEKVGRWLGAGVRLVWVLDQVRRDGRVYRADGTIPTVGPDDELDGEDVLPGFRCPLRNIL